MRVEASEFHQVVQILYGFKSSEMINGCFRAWAFRCSASSFNVEPFADKDCRKQVNALTAGSKISLFLTSCTGGHWRNAQQVNAVLAESVPRLLWLALPSMAVASGADQTIIAAGTVCRRSGRW